MTGSIDEPITITEYDPAWPRYFEEERARVAAALGASVQSIEHCGSTAVPGLAGKPIVDLLVGVRDLGETKRRILSLLSLGYEDSGETMLPGRVYLKKRGDPPPFNAFNAAVTAVGSPFWRVSLAVRDYLRAHPEEAAAYAAEKRRVLASGAALFSTYSREKESFVSALRDRAMAWTSVRAVGVADAGAVRALRLRALREDPDPFLSSFDEESARSSEEMADFLRATEKSGGALLGWFRGGVLIGMLGVGRKSERKARHRAFLWGMYVAPEDRRQHGGTALLDAALAYARGMAGVTQVELWVATTAEGARALYARAGFREVGVLPAAMRDGERAIDEALLVKPLLP